jgi:hypothetical protein
MESFLDRVNDVIQDLEDARGKCLALGLDTLALRLHESVNTMLDLKDQMDKVNIAAPACYNNSAEIMAMVAKQLMEKANEQGKDY